MGLNRFVCDGCETDAINQRTTRVDGYGSCWVWRRVIDMVQSNDNKSGLLPPYVQAQMLNLQGWVSIQEQYQLVHRHAETVEASDLFRRQICSTDSLVRYKSLVMFPFLGFTDLPPSITASTPFKGGKVCYSSGLLFVKFVAKFAIRHSLWTPDFILKMCHFPLQVLAGWHFHGPLCSLLHCRAKAVRERWHCKLGPHPLRKLPAPTGEC